MKNYYQTLGVSKSSSKSDIKTAYRKLAMKYHPDKNANPDAVGNFIRITEAYEVLVDDSKRKIFDEHLNNQSTVNVAVSSEFSIWEVKWRSYGKSQAEKYSKMDFNEFIHEVLDTVQFHGKHIAKIGGLAYLFIFSGIMGFVMAFFMLTDMDSSGGVTIYMFLFSAGMIWLGVGKINNASTQYKSEMQDRTNAQ